MSLQEIMDIRTKCINDIYSKKVSLHKLLLSYQLLQNIEMFIEKHNEFVLKYMVPDSDLSENELIEL